VLLFHRIIFSLKPGFVHSCNERLMAVFIVIVRRLTCVAGQLWQHTAPQASPAVNDFAAAAYLSPSSVQQSLPSVVLFFKQNSYKNKTIIIPLTQCMYTQANSYSSFALLRRVSSSTLVEVSIAQVSLATYSLQKRCQFIFTRRRTRVAEIRFTAVCPV